MTLASFDIGGRKIGDGAPVFIIGEAGVNHNGDREMAFRLIDAAKEASVDAVKFQSFVTEELVTPSAPKADYQARTTQKAGAQFEMLKALELSWDDHVELKAYCDKVGLLFLSTPFDPQGLAMLKKLGVAAYKVSSTDTTNIPFINEIASDGKPVILSTGMSYLKEVGEAAAVLKKRLGNRFALLQCTSNYPTDLEEVNLRTMPVLKQTFDCVVGFSDHTRGLGASPYAVAMGASIIEKHFTLDKSLPGPDHPASLDPQELKSLVRTIRQVETMLGSDQKQPTASEMKTRHVMQKSVVARIPIQKGTVLEAKHLTCKRPSGGLAPREYYALLGKVAQRDLSKDELVTMDALS